MLASETNFHQASHACVTLEFLVQSDIKGLKLKLAWELGDRYFPVLFSRSLFSFQTPPLNLLRDKIRYEEEHVNSILYIRPFFRTYTKA